MPQDEAHPARRQGRLDGEVSDASKREGAAPVPLGPPLPCLFPSEAPVDGSSQTSCIICCIPARHPSPCHTPGTPTPTFTPPACLPATLCFLFLTLFSIKSAGKFH